MFIITSPPMQVMFLIIYFFIQSIQGLQIFKNYLKNRKLLQCFSTEQDPTTERRKNRIMTLMLITTAPVVSSFEKDYFAPFCLLVLCVGVLRQEESAWFIRTNKPFYKNFLKQLQLSALVLQSLAIVT